MSRTVPLGLVSQGFQKITSNSTATTLNSTCIQGTHALISVETQSARIVFDGSTPAASTGILLTAANSPYFFENVPLSGLRCARVAAGSIVIVQPFSG